MRWSYVIPRIIFLVVIYVFFYFFFDKLLKISFKKTLESIFGAKVEISDLKTSFLNGSLVIKGVCVGSVRDEFRNLFEFDELYFKIKPSQLFRKKFIIENAEIKGLLFNGKRKTSAKLKKTPSFFAPYVDKYSDIVKDFAYERFSEIKKEGIEKINFEFNNLETAKILDDIKKNKIEIYKGLYDELSSFNIEERLKMIESDFKDFKNEKNFIKQVKLASKIKKEIDSLYKELKEKQRKVEDVFKKTKDFYTEINKAKKSDIERIMQLAKIPSLDTTNIAMLLFGKVFVEKYATYSGYFEKASQLKKYMPEKAKDRIFKEKRKRGRYIHFPLDESYPTFLLVRAYMDGVLSPENPINFKATLENISIDPNAFQKPAIFKLSGSKDNSQLDIIARVYLSSDAWKTNFDFRYTGIKISNISFGVNKRVEYILKSAGSDVLCSGYLSSDDINLPVNIKFYDIDSSANVLLTSQKNIDAIIEKTLAGLKRFNVEFVIKGKISKPSFVIRSDVANLISKELELSFKKEVDVIKSKIEQRIDEEISKRLEEINSYIKENEDKILNKINLELKNIEGIRQSIENEVSKKIKI